MLRLPRLRRPLAAAVPLLLVASLAAACGGSDDPVDPLTGEERLSRLDAVSISGDVGEAPELSWKGDMTAGQAEAETLVEGDGPALAKGDTYYASLVAANGYTQKTLVDTYGDDASPSQLTVGSPPQQAATLADLMAFGVSQQVQAGVTVGSRIAITGTVDEVVGGGNLLNNPALAKQAVKLDIGYTDSLLIVVDVLQPDVLDGPDGQQQKAPAWFPTIEFDKGEPTRLDFTGTPAPDGQLRAALLKKGTGERVAKGDTLVVDYLGQLPDADEPFDASYPRDEPLTTPIGQGAVVAGWDKKLVGVPVGSRVLLEIPPEDGYGDQGRGEDIPPGSTLYFVIDVLGAI